MAEEEDQLSLARLVAQFPLVDPDILSAVLQRVDYNVDAAIEALERTMLHNKGDNARRTEKGKRSVGSARGRSTDDFGGRPLTSRSKQRLEQSDEALAKDMQQRVNRLPSARRRQLEDQVSEDELLARVIAIEEDEKFARKLQSDLEAGLDPPTRPYSGLRSQLPTKSEGALNEIGGDSSTRPLAATQNSLSREMMSQNNLAMGRIPRRESISRSGGLSDLRTEERPEPVDEAAARATALKGSVPASANLSANLMSDVNVNSTGSEAEPTAFYSAHPEDSHPEDSDEEFSALMAKNTQSTSGSSQYLQDAIQAQPESPPPQRRAMRPESARRSAKRHQPLRQEEEEYQDTNTDIAIHRIQDDRQTTFGLADPQPLPKEKHPWPARSDSLGYPTTDQDDDDDDDHLRNTDIIFTEATRSTSETSAVSSSGGTINAELEELFTYIAGYEPQTFELNPELKCFILDYMPSIGDIDPIIKIPPPSRYPDDPSKPVNAQNLSSLGATVLDEPNIEQSDPAVLDLRLRALQKSESATPKLTPSKIRSIQLGPGRSAPDGQKALSQWIQNVYNLHLQTPQDKVEYFKRMPDVEKVMAQWPDVVEESFNSGEIRVPPAEIDLSLRDYAQLACNMVDIPVHVSSKEKKKKPNEGRTYIESLHVLFTLYAEFKNSQHFGHRQRVAVAAEGGSSD
ncbi:hypothetical protein SpCBS45565_g06966 [Spizellomyces sp. 'palustris']|nr:hypothetical protein SpCBS45565_g06966 [Spizellomyces sp. 'palustris']